MTDDPKRAATEKRVRHHEVDIEPHGHPGEPRHVRSSDHEWVCREPVPEFGRGARQGRAAAG